MNKTMDQHGRRERKNSVISSRKVSVLIKNMEKEVRLKGFQLKEWAELKTLKEKCCSRNTCEAFAAFQGIIMLVKKKVLTGSQTLSFLISLLPSVAHYTPLVMTIGDVLLFDLIENDGENKSEYNYSDKPHPFIIMLKHDTEKCWDAIFCYIQFLLHNYKLKFTDKMEMLSPVLHYIFLDPSFSSLPFKNDLFGLLLEKIYEPQIKFLLVELLTWQKLDISYCRLIEKTIHYLLKLPEAEVQEIIAALIPCLAVTIKWLILNSHNPVLWIDLLSKLLEINSDGCSVVLYILSDVILETPTLFINKLVETCTSIIYSSSCNKFIAHKFAAVSLVWMVNPSPLAEPLFGKLECVIKFLAVKCKSSEWNNTTSNLNNNPYFKILKNSSSDVKIAFEMAILTDSWVDQISVLKWLKNLLKSNDLPVQTSLQTIISGIIVNENDDEIVDICSDILLRASATNSDLSFFYLCLIFFKLSRETEPKRQLKYLQSLSKMAKSKENVPLIIGIIEMLKSGSMTIMWSVVIDLYLKLWKTDKRTYPYLHKALFTCSSQGEDSWELNIMKAIAMRDICRLSPEVHGKSLVSKLSDVLNDCDNSMSGIPSAIAIEAVIELCKASVTDISGTWRTLKPKLSRDKRTEVIISLCTLFSEIPTLKAPGLERDALINDVIPRLWNYALSSNLEVVKAALGSLSKFNAESYGPKLLPDILKSEIELPRQYCKNAHDIPKNEFLDQLQYIPGECWIEFMYIIDSRAIPEAGNMLKLLIEEELKSLPRNHFFLADEAPEPTDYNHLPHSSICRVLVRQVKNYLGSQQPRNNRVPKFICEVLRILSLDYSKCLPCLDWSFLQNFFTLGDECKRYSVFILAKQSSASKAGRKTFENYVASSLSRFKDIKELIYLYNILPFVCISLGANIFRQFLDKTIRSSFNYSVKSGADQFENILKHIKSTLESNIVPEPRKALLTAHIQNIYGHVPPEHKIMKVYADFAAGLPLKATECITSPASWPKVTSENIRRSISVKMAIALQPECLKPMVLFNEIIDAECKFPGEGNLIITSFLEILRKKRGICHADWLVELIRKIQNSISSSGNISESLNVTLLLLDIFIISIIIISGYDFFILEQEAIALRNLNLSLFPVALFELLELANYSSTSPKIIDFIYSLSKWKSLPEIYAEALQQSILTNRTNKYCLERNRWQKLFYTQRE